MPSTSDLPPDPPPRTPAQRLRRLLLLPLRLLAGLGGWLLGRDGLSVLGLASIGLLDLRFMMWLSVVALRLHGWLLRFLRHGAP